MHGNVQGNNLVPLTNSNFQLERFALGQEVTWKCGESADNGLFVNKIGEDSMISDNTELFRESLMRILKRLSG